MFCVLLKPPITLVIRILKYLAIILQKQRALFSVANLADIVKLSTNRSLRSSAHSLFMTFDRYLRVQLAPYMSMQ